jgi:iron complex outermembrane receptor protein
MNVIALPRSSRILLAAALVAAFPPLACSEEASQSAAAGELETVIVTARLRREDAQTVPVSLSVVDAAALTASGTNNISQITQLVPSLNYVSPNPRNTAFTIRGLGSSVVAIAQANDGLESGVGFYVDQVYHARPATAAFDFLDLERVEVLRGPQGTLFGKNTTAGAINISSREPGFDPEVKLESSLGNNGYWQAKASAGGALIGDVLAGRISGAITQRNGVIHNVRTGADLNDVHNSALRGQLLFRPSGNFRLRLIADFNRFNNTCCTQVYYTVAPTLKPAARQYPALAAGQNYAPPSLNPYDRLTDIDGPLKVDTSEGGVTAIADWNLGAATLTSVSAWRFWKWDAENDRDYTGLPIQLSQHIPSRQDQYSQELRVASNGQRAVDYVAGLYWFRQTIIGHPITIYGPLAAYWLLGPPPAIPANLLDGYGTIGRTRFHSDSYATFGEATWHLGSRLALTGGLRYTWESKDGQYSAPVSGGLATTNTSLINSQLSIIRPQAYQATTTDNSPTGRLLASFTMVPQAMFYLSYARGSKSGGINMSGLPLDATNQPSLATAVIKPEKNTTYELGMKTNLLGRRLLVNFDVYQSDVHDFQANVVDTGPGALRGYLANIEQVRVKGAEVDASFIVGGHFTGHLSVAYADGNYVSYRNGPCPIELIASSTTVCDLSGRPMSNLPHWAGSLGGEYAQPLKVVGLQGEGYLHADLTSRSGIYGDASDSQYTTIGGYTTVNVSIGYRQKGWEASLWARNLLNRNYMQTMTVQAGNSGLIVGTPSDPRSAGIMLRAGF